MFSTLGTEQMPDHRSVADSAARDARCEADGPARRARAPRSRPSRGRSVAAAAATLLAAAGMSMVSGQFSPAAAATKFDGTWTVDNGGTGQVILNGDYTYTSTCTRLASFPNAHCPAPTGTFSFTYTSPYITFTGSDGSTVSMRWSGDAVNPSSMSEGGYGGVILDRGTTFKCSLFYDSTYAFAKSPLVYKDVTGTKGFALGSNQSVGAIGAGNYVFLAETAPGYFVKASKCP